MLFKRSSYIKLRRKSRLFVIWIQEWMFNTAVMFMLVVSLLLIWRALGGGPSPFKADIDTLAAFRVPQQAMSNLYTLSNRYELPFSEVLAIYGVANDFFPQYWSPRVEIGTLKDSYITGFKHLRRQYSAKDIRPYFKLIDNLLSELEYFPIPLGYDYIYSDTWPSGTMFIDRENTGGRQGRIPVLSISEGQITQTGWSPQRGYYVVVSTESGTRILYASLHSLATSVEQGKNTIPGQALGLMGRHLHIGISPQTSLTNSDFWINPYPFLRHLEEKMYIFPTAVYTRDIEEPLYFVFLLH